MRIKPKYRDENNIPPFFLIRPNTQKKKKHGALAFTISLDQTSTKVIASKWFLNVVTCKFFWHFSDFAQSNCFLVHFKFQHLEPQPKYKIKTQNTKYNVFTW